MHRMKTLLEQLQQLAPLAAQATTGPWVCAPSPYEPTVHAWNDELQHYEKVVDADCFTNPQAPHLAYEAGANNAAFIAAARNLLTPENMALLIGALTASADAPR